MSGIKTFKNYSSELLLWKLNRSHFEYGTKIKQTASTLTELEVFALLGRYAALIAT
jgi:hypothetical protein